MRRLRHKSSQPGNEKRNLVTDKFYLSNLWRAVRRKILRSEPACRVCERYYNIPKVATVLDHFRPRRFWPELELVEKNMVPMCDSCHASKSGLERHVHSRNEWERKVLPKYNKL